MAECACHIIYRSLQLHLSLLILDVVTLAPVGTHPCGRDSHAGCAANWHAPDLGLGLRLTLALANSLTIVQEC